MKLKTRLVAVGIAASLGLAAASAGAEEQMAWIHSVNAAAKTITLGSATGSNSELYTVSDTTQLSGPEGSLTLSELPSLDGGSNEDYVSVSFEAAAGGNVLFWLTLNPPLDQ